MYELLVLSLLMHFPIHAYLISKICNDILGPWEKISRGTLSLLLSKLEKTGLITEADPAIVPFNKDRPSRTYSITPAGRERFICLMMDTTSSHGSYQKLFHIKALHLGFLPVDDQLYLVNHYLYYCQTAINHLQRESGEFQSRSVEQEHQDSQFNETVLDVMLLNIEKWKLEVCWARRLHEKTMLKNNSPGEDAAQTKRV